MSMANDYNILADHIVSKYIECISGDDIGDTFVDESPDKRVMVGMLAENRIEERFDGGYAENNSTRFESVPSMSISFVVKKNMINREEFLAQYACKSVEAIREKKSKKSDTFEK